MIVRMLSEKCRQVVVGSLIGSSIIALGVRVAHCEQEISYESLEASLEDSDCEVRFEAARDSGQKLARSRFQSERTFPPALQSKLITVANDTCDKAAAASLYALSASSGPNKAVDDALTLGLSHKSGKVRTAAIDGIGNRKTMTSAARKELTKLAKGRSLKRRAHAIRTFGAAGSAEDEEVLILALSDAYYPEIRREAASALLELKLHSQAVADALTKAAGDRRPAIRNIAVRALHDQARRKDREEIPDQEALSGRNTHFFRLIKEHLNSDEIEVRVSALESLKSLDTAQVSHLEEQVVALTEAKDARTRGVAVEAITPYRFPSAISFLVPRLKDKNNLVKQQAAKSLAGFRLKAKPFISELVPLLSDTSIYVRIAAAKAFEQLGYFQEEAVDHLLALSGSDDLDERKAAYAALGPVGRERKEVAQHLEKCAEEEDELKEICLSALKRYRTPRPVIQEAEESEISEPIIRYHGSSDGSLILREQRVIREE